MTNASSLQCLFPESRWLTRRMPVVATLGASLTIYSWAFRSSTQGLELQLSSSMRVTLAFSHTSYSSEKYPYQQSCTSRTASLRMLATSYGETRFGWHGIFCCWTLPCPMCGNSFKHPSYVRILIPFFTLKISSEKRFCWFLHTCATHSWCQSSSNFSSWFNVKPRTRPRQLAKISKVTNDMSRLLLVVVCACIQCFRSR